MSRLNTIANMAEDAYNKKISDLQKHIPFLENMIILLKDPKGKPREAQLDKLVAVHNMITDRNKKWKFETLLKCEEVITKLQTKVMANRLSAFSDSNTTRTNRITTVSQTVSEIMNALKFNNARAKLNCEITTPKSPSPVRDPPIKLPPKIIPTEATKSMYTIDPNEFTIDTWKTGDRATEERYVNEKPDIYSSAAKSLITAPTKPMSIFDRLGPAVVPGPLLSDADLESLRIGDDFVDVTCSNNEQVNTKEKEKPPPDLNLSKTTPRIVPVPSSKPKITKLECPKQHQSDAVKAKIFPLKMEKLKDGDIFGDLLTSIDSKILEDSKKKEGKKKELEKKGLKRHERKEKGKGDIPAEAVVSVKEEKIEVKVDVPSDKPVRLADKYNPKPRKHVNADIEKEVDDSIQKRMENDPRISLKIDIFTNSKERTFENRDPRRRLSVMQESPPQQQQQQQLQLQPSGPHYVPSQSQRPNIELPVMRDPRRPQSRFSPPPPMLSSFSQTQNFHQNFVPSAQARNVFNNHQSRLDNFHNVSPFPQQQNFFNQNYQSTSLRYDQNAPSVRFEPPPPSSSQHSSFSNVPKKSFNPFEPLDSSRDEKDSSEFYTFNNQILQPLQSPPSEPQSNSFQRGNFISPPRGGGGGGGAAKFRVGTNYNQYNSSNHRQDRNRFDRNNDYKRPAPIQNKSTTSEISQERTKKEEDYKYSSKNISRTKYDEMYSKLEKDKETFSSPLESLYSDPKSSIKTTILSFRIPKKHKAEDVESSHVEKQKEKGNLKPGQKTKVKSAGKAKPGIQESKTKKKPVINDESVSDSGEILVKKKKTKKVQAKKDPSPPPPPPLEAGSSDSDVPLKVVVKKRAAKAAAKKKPLNESDDSNEVVGRKSRRAKTAAKKRLIEDSDETDFDDKAIIKKLIDKGKEDDVQAKEEENDVKTSEGIEVKDLKVVVENNIDMNKKVINVEKKIDEEVKTEEEDAFKKHDQPETLKLKNEEEKLPKKPKETKSDIDKAKELLTEARAGSLDMNDKELIEFVLQNFKKIRQLFKKDSSSDEEDEVEVKKKKKKELEKIDAPVKDDADEEQLPILPQEFLKEEKPKIKPVVTAIKRKPGPKPKGKFKKGGTIKKVVKSVGCMTRTRSATLLAAPKRPRRSELDKLHEDIKEMLMGGEVLTASTKRTCTIQKDEQDETTEKSTADDENINFSELMDCSNVDPSKLKAKSTNLRVLIEKTDLAKLLIKDELKKKEIDKLVNDEVVTEEKPQEEVVDDDGGNIEPQTVFNKTSPKQKFFKKKKRRFNWASGVIKKKKKSSLIQKTQTIDNKIADENPSDDESIAESFESCPELAELVYVEPSKEYYPKDSKSECKLCPFKGKFIVQHYKGAHPEHEVLIARANPSFCQQAILESVESNFESVEAFEILNKQKTKKIRYNYQCPFCLAKFLNESSETFYDHLSSHTGEYRFSCPYCGFKTSTGKNLRPHIMSSHNRSSENVVKPSWPAPPNFKYVFAYLCAECHYIQLNKTAVEDHVKIYHLESQKIYKVNMSAMPYEEVDDTEGEVLEGLEPSLVPDKNLIDKHIDEAIERVVLVQEEPARSPTMSPRKKKRKKGVVAPQVKQLKLFELISELVEIEPTIKVEPPDEPPETEATPLELQLQTEATSSDSQVEAEPKPPESQLEAEPTPPESQMEAEPTPPESQMEIEATPPASQMEIETTPPASQMEIETTPPESQMEIEPMPPELQMEIEPTPPESRTEIQSTPPESQAESETAPPLSPIKAQIAPPKQKSPDLNAFMCNPELTVEEQSVEENRLRKMKEIHEIVKPSRTSIVDKLQSRLDTTPSPSAELQSPPLESDVPTSPACPEKPPPLVFIDRSSQKKSIDSVLPKHPVTASEALPQKKVAPISNIINRLQDKLESEINKLPPLTHYRSLKNVGPPELSLRIGPVQVMLNKKFVLYACFVPTCVFCTDKKSIFETHCKVTHKNFMCTFTEPGKCDICHVKIDHEDNYVTMHDIYLHILSSHDDFLKKLASTKDDDPSQEEVRNKEKEKVKDKEKAKEKEKASENVVPEFRLPHEVPNLILQGDDENTGAKYPFVITSVTSLAPPKKNNYEEAAVNALLKKTTALSSPIAVKRQDIIRPVPFSKLCAPNDLTAVPTTLDLSPLSINQPVILNATNVNVAPGTILKKQPVVFNKFVITSNPSTTSSQQPVLLNHFIGKQQSTSGNVLPKISNLTVSSTPKTTTASSSPSLIKTTAASSSSSLTKTTASSSLIKTTSSPSLIKTTAASSSSSLTKTTASSSLTKTTSSPSLAKTTASSSVTKTTSSPSLAKTTTSSSLIKTTSSPSLTKTTASSSVIKTTSSPSLAKTTASSSLTKTTSSPSLTKTTSSSSLTKTTSSPSLTKTTLSSSLTKTTLSSSLIKTTTPSSSPKRQIVLRDIPLKLTEKTQPRKTAKALSSLLSLKKNRQLFKCPEFYCNFSTDLSVELTKHMSGAHGFTEQALLFCLYCDYKVSCGTYAIHVEVKHGHCAYGCEYCLHRTTSVYFMNFHQELQHPQLPPRLISIPLFPTSVKAISSDATLSLRKIILPYVCGNWGCKFKTLFTYEFVDHLITHATALRCGICTTQFATPIAMVHHWAVHKVYPFQCKYCLYGNKSTYGIGRHQAFCHYSSVYSVIYRIFVADSTLKKPDAYNYEEDEVYSRLLRWPEDADTPEGRNLVKIYQNLSISPGIETTIAEKGDESNSKEPSSKENEIEVIDVLMEDFLNKHQIESVAEEKCCYDEPVIIANVNVDSDDVDPLSFDSTLETLQKEMDDKTEDHSNGALDETDLSDSLEEENLGHEELSGKELFKCKCAINFLSSVQLRTHIIQCQKQKPFLCAHCTRTFKTVTGLLHHYRDHGRARFKCSLCQFKRRHQVAIRNHMKLVHNVANVMLLPVIAKKVDIDNDDFVLRPRQGGRKSTDSSTGSIKPSAEEAPTAETKLVFGPNEIDLLPRQPIYQFDVKCATCSYATKVKSNMVRHLQFHQTEQEVPVIAPVNPVPCLEKSERMFDKMVNLASSSHIGGRMGGVKNEKVDKNKEQENVNIPAFVPTSKRFVCGAENCNYLCPEEAMLRRHLTAFHSDDGNYTCHLCNIKISEEKSLNIESVMKHLKLHDCNLYQCMYCKMIHHLRHKMERHLSDKHFDKAANLIIIREKVKTPESDAASILEKELSKEPKPWRCAMCKYRCTTFNDIKAHASNKHFVDAKYKCALCSYKGELKDSFPEHFEKKHPGHELDVIVCFYKDDEVEKPKPPVVENEAEFNTTPIWQRNKHVKHIRGILLDESNAGKITKTPTLKKLKSSKLTGTKKDDEEDVTVPKANTGGKVAVSPKKSSTFGIVETATTRGSQKTFKIVKRALKSTKGNNKAVKISEHKIEGTAIENNTNKKSESASLENDVIDITSYEEPADQKTEDKPSNENENIESSVSVAVNTSLKLVNIQTLLEDPSNSGMPGFINLTKTMQKKSSGGGDLETIEILDDDGDIGVSSNKKRKIDLTLREINKMSKEELLAGNYMGTYGPYGSPWDGKFKCPLCEKMTCRSEKEFTVHLYRELQYGAYKCNVCGETDLSEEAVKKHYVQKHGVLNSDDIIQMGWDRQIEAWIHKIIAFQGRILKLEKKAEKREGTPESSVPAEKTSASPDISSTIETEEDDKSKTLYCTFCDYKCKYSGDRRKHELRHWSKKPFCCNYCSYETIYKPLIMKHIHRVHKDCEVSYSENNMDDGVVIKPVKFLKRKVAMQTQTPEGEPSIGLQNSKETKDPEETQLSNISGQNLQCFYCAFVGTMSEQTTHHKTQHSDLPLKLYSYKCNYCEMVFVTLVSLNTHFFTNHPGLEQSFYSVENQSDRTFRCPTCFYTSNDYSIVKYHVRSHFKPFQCLYCDERFSYWNQIYKHHFESHPASIYEYKYILGVEKDTWKEMEAIQVKKGGSYKVFTETKSTKRKKYPKKLDPTSSTGNMPEEDEVEEDDDVMIIEEDAPQAKLSKPNETVKVKATARKSTSTQLKPRSEGFSYYGSVPDKTNLSNIITTVEIMGASVTMYAEQLSKIFNLFPIVLVEDCGHL